MYEVRWQDFDKRDYVILILTLFSKLKLYQKLTIFLFFLYSFQTNEVGVSTNRHCDMLHILILNWDRCPSQTCTAVSVRTPSPTASPPATTSPPQTSPCVRSASSPPAGRSSWSWWRMEWSAPCVWRPWPSATSRCWGPGTRRWGRRWKLYMLKKLRICHVLIYQSNKNYVISQHLNEF